METSTKFKTVYYLLYQDENKITETAVVILSKANWK